MKKYISVFEMLIRSTLYKVLGVLVIIVALQGYLFWNTVMNGQGGVVEDGLEVLVDNSNLLLPLAAGFLLITGILCLSGCNIGSNQSYTLQRLRISERAVYWLQALYNSMCYFLLWASQVGVTIGISHWFMENATELTITNQTLVIAFYRNAYLHSILPMEDAVGWAILAGIILGCGINAAKVPYQQRRGKISVGILMMVGATLVTFPRGLGEDFSMLGICLVILFAAGWISWGLRLEKKGVQADE